MNDSLYIFDEQINIQCHGTLGYVFLDKFSFVLNLNTNCMYNDNIKIKFEWYNSNMPSTLPTPDTANFINVEPVRMCYLRVCVETYENRITDKETNTCENKSCVNSLSYQDSVNFQITSNSLQNKSHSYRLHGQVNNHIYEKFADGQFMQSVKLTKRSEQIF